MKKIDTNIEFFKEDLNQAIGSGIYQISIYKDNKSKILYIGESETVLKRCGEHLYKLNENPGYFGFTEDILKDSNITLKFELLEKIDDAIFRKKREVELIKNESPLIQSGINDHLKNLEDRIVALREFLNMN